MLALLLGFLLPIPETAANYTYSGYRWLPPDAPLALDACEANGDVVRGIARSSVVSYGTGFTITGAKTATRVRMRFTFADDHWQPVRVREEDITGTFTPGSKIMRTHRYGGEFRVHDVYPHTAVVLCSPVRVDFADGSRWAWSPPPAPYTAPGAAGRAESPATPAPIDAPQPRPVAPSEGSPPPVPRTTPISDPD